MKRGDRVIQSLGLADQVRGSPNGIGRRVRPVILVLGLTWTLSGCMPPSPAPSLTAVQATPPAIGLMLDRGRVALTEERFGDAVREFGEALQVQPNSVEARLGLAEGLLGQGEAVKARETFAAAAQHADSAQRTLALQGQGIALLRQGEIDAAQPLLAEATTLQPNQWRAWNALGQVHDARGEWEPALMAYEQALTIRSSEPALHNNLGMSRLRAGDSRAAERSFLRALELAPSLAVAEANLRLALAMQGRYDAALVGVSKQALPDVLNNVGYAAMMRGDRERARALFQRALEASPSFHASAAANLRLLEAGT